LRADFNDSKTGAVRQCFVKSLQLLSPLKDISLVITGYQCKNKTPHIMSVRISSVLSLKKKIIILTNCESP